MIDKFKLLFTNKYIELALFLSLFFILEFEYYNFVNLPLFQEKMGFAFRFSVGQFILAKVFLAILLYTNFKLKGFYYFVNSLFLILLSFPVIIMFEFMPQTPVIIVLSALLFHALLYWSSHINFKLNNDRFIIKPQFKIPFFIILTLLMLIPFFINYGLSFNLKSFIFKDIYQIRELAVAKSTKITAYFFSWLVKIVIPMALIISWRQKKWFFSIFFIATQLYLYTIDPHKSAFFTLFVVLIMVIKDSRKQTNFIVFSFIGLIIFSKLISLFQGNIMAESIVVRRTFFLPAIIINNYFDFFKDNPLYLSHSIFKYFIEYPFPSEPAQLISLEYYNSPKGSANSGFISDGYMNFGYIGILLNIIGITILFKIIEQLKIASDFNGIILVIIYTLISGYFLTSLLTHGIILFLILSFFFIRNTQTPDK